VKILPGTGRKALDRSLEATRKEAYCCAIGEFENASHRFWVHWLFNNRIRLQWRTTIRIACGNGA
jgi:hypothetical protein